MNNFIENAFWFLVIGAVAIMLLLSKPLGVIILVVALVGKMNTKKVNVVSLAGIGVFLIAYGILKFDTTVKVSSFSEVFNSQERIESVVTAVAGLVAYLVGLFKKKKDSD